MVFNATFNNISVISRRPVLLVEEAGVPRNPTDPVFGITVGPEQTKIQLGLFNCRDKSPSGPTISKIEGGWLYFV